MKTINESEITFVKDTYLYKGLQYSPIWESQKGTFLCSAVNSGNWNKYITVGPESLEEFKISLKEYVDSLEGIKNLHELAYAMSTQELVDKYPCDGECICNWD